VASAALVYIINAVLPSKRIKKKKRLAPSRQKNQTTKEKLAQ